MEKGTELEKKSCRSECGGDGGGGRGLIRLVRDSLIHESGTVNASFL